MKKLFLFSVALLGFAVTISAQSISPNAIGLRLGDSDGLGAEVSYQRALAETTRLEIDLGWRDGKNYDGFKLAALHQWVWNLDGNFNWYAGVGGGFGAFSFDNIPANQDDSESFLFAAGDIGIEYDFDFPLLLSLDFRPEIGFGEDRFNNNDLDFDIALGVRYQF
jgi:opacity protein-like surface antigen